jgi:hypothetical protein
MLAAAWRALRRIHLPTLALLVFSLYLFGLAITLMRAGAAAFGPLISQTLSIDHFADAVGFGWLLSYAVMSGSPVAGAALALLDAGALDRLGAYGMIVGSRFGASFVVLLIGLLYVLRGRSRVISLSMGLLSLSVAFTVQLLAIPVGLFLIVSRRLDLLQMTTPAALTGLTERLLEPVATLVSGAIPEWGTFALGLGLMVASFNLFDRCIPDMTLREGGMGTLSQFVYRPWVMFLVGSLVTLVSMSVSISLGLLVPLSQRGLVRRENVIPYIMGANISTFVDTLVAAVLIGNPEAFTVVAVELLSLACAAIVLLILRYDLYERALLHVVEWTTADRTNLILFVTAIVIVPLVLILL